MIALVVVAVSILSCADPAQSYSVGAPSAVCGLTAAVGYLKFFSDMCEDGPNLQ
jgi:hypothetical protein